MAFSRDTSTPPPSTAKVRVAGPLVTGTGTGSAPEGSEPSTTEVASTASESRRRTRVSPGASSTPGSRRASRPQGSSSTSAPENSWAGEATTRVVSTLTRFDLAGGPYNAVQAARGREGSFTGSISYAVEILDASTQELLGAYVAKQYPNAWNLGATFGRLDAARVGIDKGAEELLAQLR